MTTLLSPTPPVTALPYPTTQTSRPAPGHLAATRALPHSDNPAQSCATRHHSLRPYPTSPPDPARLRLRSRPSLPRLPGLTPPRPALPDATCRPVPPRRWSPPVQPTHSRHANPSRHGPGAARTDPLPTSPPHLVCPRRISPAQLRLPPALSPAARPHHAPVPGPTALPWSTPAQVASDCPALCHATSSRAYPTSPPPTSQPGPARVPVRPTPFRHALPAPRPPSPCRPSSTCQPASRRPGSTPIPTALATPALPGGDPGPRVPAPTSLPFPGRLLPTRPNSTAHAIPVASPHPPRPPRSTPTAQPTSDLPPASPHLPASDSPARPRFASARNRQPRPRPDFPCQFRPTSNLVRLSREDIPDERLQEVPRRRVPVPVCR